MDRKRVAIFGGSFNPPHIGHQMILFYLSHSFNFDQIWVFPVYHHYFQKDRYLIGYKDRENMAKLAFEKISSKIIISDIENRNQFSKSYDTVTFLTKEYKNIDFTLILGEDNYNDRGKWYKFSDIESMVDIKYMGREGVDSDLELPFKFPTISSSKIRKNIDKMDQYLDSDVVDYIKRSKLYI